MNALMPYLLRPWWLLAVPVLAWLLWRLWHRQRQVGRWQRLIPAAFQAVLLTQGRQRTSRLPWALLALGWALGMLVLLGPSWQRLEQPSLKRAAPLVVLLEMTPAMLAGDVPPTRLEQARRKLLDLLLARADAHTAVVVYAGSAHTLVPLSDDLATTANLLQAIKPSLMPESGQRVDLAVEQGLALLEQGAQGRGRLLLIGTGIPAEQQQAIGQQLGDDGERLLILGVGTPEGAPIARAEGGFVKDADGAILIPRLDDNGLRRFATQLGSGYQQARLDAADLDSLGLLDRTGAIVRQPERLRLDAWLDQGYWLLLPLLLVAACAARRGWLFGLALLLVQPAPAEAFELRDLWLRPDQQGQRLLDEGRPGEAAERFADRRWQGIARYLAGDYAAAISRFAEGDSAADHYNRGNALARSGDLEAAREAYEQALDMQPGLEPALQNKALVEELLRQRDEAAQAAEAPEPGEQGRQAEDGGQPSAASPEQGNTQTAPRLTDQASASDTEQIAQTPAETDSAASASSDAPRPISEQYQAAEQWLRQIPDDPGELLRRKFLYEQRKRQEASQ